MPGQYRKPTELTQEEFEQLPMVEVEFSYKPANYRQAEYFGFKFILFDEMTLTSDQLKDENRLSELDFLRMKTANGWPATLSKNRSDDSFIGNVIRYSPRHMKHYQLSRGVKHVKHKDGNEKDYPYFAVDIYLSDQKHYKTFFLSKDYIDYIESTPAIKALFNERKSKEVGNYGQNQTSSFA